MATDKERLERLENALIFLAGGGAGFAAGRQGIAPAARAGARLAVGTPQGRAVLAGFAAKELRDELNRRDDQLARDELGDQVADILRIPRAATPAPLPLGLAVTTGAKAGKRAKSKFNKAVSAGMKAAKASTSYGKKGTINNAKKAFSAVTKEASRINKGAKVAKKGIKRKIGLAIKKVLK
jgi:hypothetical protein